MNLSFAFIDVISIKCEGDTIAYITWETPVSDFEGVLKNYHQN